VLNRQQDLKRKEGDESMSVEINHQTVGALLKARRENLDISQREIAHRLGYRNINFISMLESGRSNIPIGRLADVLGAYEIDGFLSIAAKGLYPECWNLMLKIIQKHPEFANKDTKEIDKEMDGAFKTTLQEYGLWARLRKQAT
jgi:transcriptional regulator with XRE-family HTH domain